MSKTAVVTQLGDFRITDLTSFSPKVRQELISQVKRIEKKVFPSSEAFDFDSELKKRNTSVVLAVKDADGFVEVAAYLVFLRMKRLTLLHKMCVGLQHRQKGVSKIMILGLRSKLEKEGCDCIQLWVNEDNKPARALYDSCGFKQVDRCEDYYGPGRTGLKMVLRFE